MKGVRFLYDYTKDGLKKMEQLNKVIINLDGIYVMSIIYIISLIILILFLKKLIDMSAKIQVLEKFTKTDHRDTQIQTVN